MPPAINPTDERHEPGRTRVSPRSSRSGAAYITMPAGPPIPFTLMRILVVSTLYPPVAFGGYEVECSGVVERLREHHEVLVLTS